MQRWTIATLVLVACGKDPEPSPPAPAPEPVPSPAPEPVGPPTETDNADAYDFGLDAAAMFDEASGTYEVLCVGSNAGGFLGTAFAVVGPGMRLGLLRADGTEFLATNPDGVGDFAVRDADPVGYVTWTLEAQGEGPDGVESYEYQFGEGGEISILVLDPASGSVHCLDYATTIQLQGGTSPPTVLTALGGPPIRLTGITETVDVTVGSSGSVTVDRGPSFDGVPDFLFQWTGGGDLAVVDQLAGDWAVTDAGGDWTIVIQNAGRGVGGVTLTGGAAGLTGLESDQINVGG